MKPVTEKLAAHLFNQDSGMIDQDAFHVVHFRLLRRVQDKLFVSRNMIKQMIKQKIK